LAFILRSNEKQKTFKIESNTIKNNCEKEEKQTYIYKNTHKEEVKYVRMTTRTTLMTSSQTNMIEDYTTHTTAREKKPSPIEHLTSHTLEIDQNKKRRKNWKDKEMKYELGKTRKDRPALVEIDK